MHFELTKPEVNKLPKAEELSKINNIVFENLN